MSTVKATYKETDVEYTLTISVKENTPKKPWYTAIFDDPSEIKDAKTHMAIADSAQRAEQVLMENHILPRYTVSGQSKKKEVPPQSKKDPSDSLLRCGSEGSTEWNLYARLRAVSVETLPQKNICIAIYSKKTGTTYFEKTERTRVGVTGESPQEYLLTGKEKAVYYLSASSDEENWWSGGEDIPIELDKNIQITVEIVIKCSHPLKYHLENAVKRAEIDMQKFELYFFLYPYSIIMSTHNFHIEYGGSYDTRTLQESIDYMLENNYLTNQCDHVSSNLHKLTTEQDLAKKSTAKDFKSLIFTLRYERALCWYCQIGYRGHWFLVERNFNTGRIYQSWQGNYTLAQRFPKDNTYKFEELLELLEEALADDDKGKQDILFGVEFEEAKKPPEYVLTIDVPDDMTLSKKIDTTLASKRKEAGWDTYTFTDPLTSYWLKEGLFGRSDKEGVEKYKCECSVRKNPVIVEEGEIQTACPLHFLQYTAISSCLSVTCFLDGGMQVGIHEALKKRVPDGGLAALKKEISEKTVIKIIAAGQGEFWYFRDGNTELLSQTQMYEKNLIIDEEGMKEKAREIYQDERQYWQIDPYTDAYKKGGYKKIETMDESFKPDQKRISEFLDWLSKIFGIDVKKVSYINEGNGAVYKSVITPQPGIETVKK
jgi:hypothetical protein